MQPLASGAGDYGDESERSQLIWKLLCGEPDSKYIRLNGQNNPEMSEPGCFQTKRFVQDRCRLPTQDMEDSPASEKSLEPLGEGSCEDIRPSFPLPDKQNCTQCFLLVMRINLRSPPLLSHQWIPNVECWPSPGLMPLTLCVMTPKG